MEREDLKVGNLYDYRSDKNTFKIIGLYEHYVWLQWLDDESIETMFLSDGNLQFIKDNNGG